MSKLNLVSKSDFFRSAPERNIRYFFLPKNRSGVFWDVQYSNSNTHKKTIESFTGYSIDNFVCVNGCDRLGKQIQSC